MKVSALQEFIRSLGGSLSAVGVQPKPLEDLRAIAHAFQPLKDLDLEHVPDFLKRASQYRGTGEVPVIAVAGLDDTTVAARKLGESVLELGETEPARIGEVEAQIASFQAKLQSSLSTLAGNFGLGASFKSDKKWLQGLTKKAAAKHAEAAATAAAQEKEAAAKAVLDKAVDAFEQIKSQITSHESYQTDAVKSAIEALAATDMKVLKTAAGEHAGKGKGVPYVVSTLVKMTGIDTKPPKAPKQPKKPKADEPTATDEQVTAMTQQLRDMIERAKDPKAVADSDVDEVLSKVSSEFSAAQQKAISETVTGQKVTGRGKAQTENAIANLRADLTAVKRLVESQNV